MPDETKPLLTKRLNLILDEKLALRLNDAAWEARVSMSEYVRQAISEKLGESADS